MKYKVGDKVIYKTYKGDYSKYAVYGFEDLLEEYNIIGEIERVKPYNHCYDVNFYKYISNRKIMKKMEQFYGGYDYTINEENLKLISTNIRRL